MPAYDYRCHSCGTVVEVIRKITDDSKVCCIHCETEMEQIITASENVVFMGDGWARKQKKEE